MSVMAYHVGGEEAASAVAFLERVLQRFGRSGGAVVAGEHVKATARSGTGNGHKRRKSRRWHRHRPMDRSTRHAVAEAYRGPETMTEIARRFGCSVEFVREVAVAAGCPLRTPGRKGGAA